MSVFARAREDLRAARIHDPAARSNLEVALTYSGVHAVWWYRLSHRLWQRRAFLLARVVSQLARWATGVEIHPGAVIGRRFFIDHGMGVVIGATAEIGDDVMFYHGVTLGGRSMRDVKRHPTLGDGVVVGAGATILGPITVGSRSVVGAGAVVVRDAPADSTLTGVPARAVPRAGADAAPDGFFVDPAIYI
ncbi:serine O-acetyltransferase EpsC [Marisediminicola sp. LYQ134]|uniref:serine O-acetyltransferase EpsC n=1 Tax=Marisediminicola sp. LYQ134 TaxID=3391061 RepID=UPI003982E4D1